MSEEKKTPRIYIKNALIWVLVVVLSLLSIIGGNRLVSTNYTFFNSPGGMITERGKVTRAVEAPPATDAQGQQMANAPGVVHFEAEIESGEFKGKTVVATQNIQKMTDKQETLKKVAPGDRVIMVNNQPQASEQSQWFFADYYRFDKIIILAVIFALLLLIFGRTKGFNTLLSFSFTSSFIFFVFVPAVMNGYNIYLFAAINCLFTIVMTLLLINGASRKTLATVIGCIAGTLLAALITVIMTHFLQLSGFVDEHSVYLTMANPDKPINLVAVIFSAIVIGALGAIMDVAMDIASSLYEISERVPDISFKKLFESGMRIGGDIMGTMANTLVLAYIGSSLAGILILLTYAPSQLLLLNRELIIIDFLQALSGSMAILLTIPLTIFACGALYLKKSRHTE